MDRVLMGLRDSRVVSVFSLSSLLSSQRWGRKSLHPWWRAWLPTDTLLDTGFDESLTLVDDLVGVKTWHGGGDDESLETSRKVLRVHDGRTFEDERRGVSTVRINP